MKPCGRWRGVAIRLALVIAVLPAAGLAPQAGAGETERPAVLLETPDLVDAVLAGELPPIAERLPLEPLVVDLEAKGREFGVHGGMMRMFIKRAKDVRYMAAYGYARLVGYDESYALQPDLLRAVEVSPDGRSVTLHLRRGHRWSDGHPFTSEDLRYWWEDVAMNEELSPKGPPVEMLIDGELPVFEVLDEVSVRYTWSAPNPRFLPALARARPIYIYRPAHYMKQFHADHAGAEGMAALLEIKNAKSWAKLHNSEDNLYRFDNPDLPILQPWVNRSEQNSQRYVLGRNPYFHRVDTRGRQLPYVDSVEMEIAAVGLIPLKVSLGEAGLQPRYLTFADAPVLKRAEASGKFQTYLWRSGAASEVALYPNLNYRDLAWRELFRDVRFRRALSLGISRKTINKVLYFGLAEPRANAALEESPLFDAANAVAWAEFDLDEANRLLDELGLDQRNDAGTRLLPDGRPLEIILETAGERQEVADALEIVTVTWAKIGVRLLVRTLDRTILRNRAYAGNTMMVAWYGWNNGIPTPDAAPTELAPVEQTNFSWPMWGQYYQTKGVAGEPPDIPSAIELMRLHDEWMSASNADVRADIWHRMLDIHADEVFVIGTVARAPLPIAAAANLVNVPSDALYAWDPGAQIGMYRIDEFFYAAGADP